ncbi:MAG: recombinase family protein, partial [Actinomycetota bacterium]
MKDTTRRAGIYVRISQDRDGKSEAPTRQTNDCREMIGRKGWTEVAVYEDRDESAFSKSAKRPQYRAMLADLKSGRIDTIVVWKLDRLARRYTEMNRVITLLDDCGGVLASVNDSVDTSTPMGQAVVGIMAAMAQAESEATSLRVRRAMASQIARGAVPKGGSRCYGYMVDGTVVPAEAQHVRWMAKKYVEGESFRQIAALTNAKGVKTSRGNEWTPAGVNQLLRSPRLGGYRLDADKQQLIKGQWKPILSKSAYQDLHSALELSRRPSERTTDPKHLLSGIAVCGTCGERLRPRLWKMPHAGMQPFPRLACVKEPGHKNCGGVVISEAAINKVVYFEMSHYVHDLHRESQDQANVQAVTKQLEADLIATL